MPVLQGPPRIDSEDLAEIREKLKVAGVDNVHQQVHTVWRWILVASYLLLGQAIGYQMGWNALFSMYFTVETLTTVGYGDFSFADASPDLQLIVGFFSIMGLFVMGAGLTVIFEQAFERERLAVEHLLTEPGDDEAGGRLSLGGAKGTKTGHASAFKLYEKAQDRLKVNLVICTASFFLTIIVGAAVVGGIEDWDWRTSIYWSCITMTSVGYGDIVPEDPLSRGFASVLMAVGVVVVGGCAGFIGSYRHFMAEVASRAQVLNQFGTDLSQEELDVLTKGEEIKQLGLSSNTKHITRAEFCLYMLIKLGRVNEEELRASQAAFDTLDVVRSGTLDKADLEAHRRRRSARETQQGLHPPRSLLS
eukprot:CAMPEP_0206456814 /NCGR_PEP_ID=MMETSP0324_2-20121206/22591_1 /ASSEMBLY_ACC=CAM_ASM_000836 /TAXON_ID=2866 /ORGANISM="Crypthecodinium cohnii, Strain Seligo" /LENGTH=361 /DNA_ID=CAMNT_0053927819 /DNA_START=162 /DNA_END=1247 /DNA_ORIENTATION=+